ncbi:MAG: glycosyltransferase family 2 protein [Pyrinomonadaceae bacterium]
MAEIDTTIVVVPRERFSFTALSLESIYEHTHFPFRLIYVDGGSPSTVRKYLKNKSREKGFTLIRTNHYLPPNEARNLGLQQVTTKYVVFIDNDVLVTPGWLEALVRCADETEAWVVGPLYLIGPPEQQRIHMAGGAAHIEDAAGERRFYENHRWSGKHLREVEPLHREPCELVEFHCLLARSECFAQLGPLDESLLSLQEHIDLCWMVRARGGTVYFEPDSIISYMPPLSISWSDMFYFMLRWSENWNASSLKHFQKKWQINDDDPGIAIVRNWSTTHRRRFLWQLRPYVDRLSKGRAYYIEQQLLSPLEMRISRYVNRWIHRRRATHQGSL